MEHYSYLLILYYRCLTYCLYTGEATAGLEGVNMAHELWSEVQFDSPVMQVAKLLIDACSNGIDGMDTEKNQMMNTEVEDVITSQDVLLICQEMRDKCLQTAVNTWHMFETEVLKHASEDIIQATELLKSQIQTKNNNKILLGKSLPITTVSQSTSSSLYNELMGIKKQIEEESLKLSTSNLELIKLEKDLFDCQENRKNQVIELLENKDLIEQKKSLLIEKKTKELSVLEEDSKIRVKTVQKLLQEVSQNCSLLNKLTYYRLVKYQSTGIEIEVVLSPKVRIQILFHMMFDNDYGKLLVTKTDVSLKQIVTKDNFVNTNNNDDDSETSLAKRYFTDFMSSEMKLSPLSQQALASVNSPSDIPPVLLTV